MLKRLISVLSAYIIWSGVAVAFEGEPSPYGELFVHCEGIQNSFECARAIERAQTKGSEGKYFSRTGLRLQLRLASRRINFRDRDSQDGNAHYYSYIKYLESQKLHVLHLQLYEGRSFVVVHHETGAIAHVDGFPNVSPDFRRFVAISDGGEAGYDPTSVEVWRVHKGQLWPEFRIQPIMSEWGPKKAIWADRRTIRIEGRCGFLETEKKDCPTIKASMSAGRWTVH